MVYFFYYDIVVLIILGKYKIFLNKTICYFFYKTKKVENKVHLFSKTYILFSSFFLPNLNNVRLDVSARIQDTNFSFK